MKRLLLLFVFASMTLLTFAQCDTTENKCVRLLSTQFISDGQLYRSFLKNAEVAEFNTVFYSGTTYRLVVGTGNANSKILFRVYDGERNLLFNSSLHGYPESWDFKFSSTLNCTIETQLSTHESGCAILLIGFKN